MNYKIFILTAFLILIQSFEIKAQRKQKLVSRAIYTEELGIDTSLTFTINDFIDKEYHQNISWGSSFKFSTVDTVEIHTSSCLIDFENYKGTKGKYELLKGNILRIEYKITERVISTDYDIIQLDKYIFLVPDDYRKEFVKSYQKSVKKWQKNKADWEQKTTYSEYIKSSKDGYGYVQN